MNDPLISDYLMIEARSIGIRRSSSGENFPVGFLRICTINQDIVQLPNVVGLQEAHSTERINTYYCVIALWKRLIDVVSVREVSLEQIQLREALNAFKFPLPTDIHLYLSGIGNICDPSGRQFYLQIQSLITNHSFENLGGTFGRIDSNNHVLYETLPAPGITVLQMMADLAPASAQPDWDLPTGLRPDYPAATMPNENLLCWKKRDRLTNDQRKALEEQGLKHESQSMLIRHVANVPICGNLLSKIVRLLRYTSMRFPRSLEGSQAQVAFISRSRDDNEVEVDRNIAAKSGRTNSYTQAPPHTASAAAIFRYRIQRRTYGEIDCVGYRFAENKIPQSWLDNCNQVFDHGPAQQLWNSSQFRISEMDGAANLMAFSNRTGTAVTKDSR